MKAIARQLRISSKKANLVAQLVRNKKVTDAIDILKFTPKKAAPLLKKVIESAAANAENNFKQKKEELVIDEIIVNEGTTYKRSIPISRGRVHPLLKRTSHITVKVKPASPVKKKESKKPAPLAKKGESKDAVAVKETPKEATDTAPKPTKPTKKPAPKAKKQ